MRISYTGSQAYTEQSGTTHNATLLCEPISELNVTMPGAYYLDVAPTTATVADLAKKAVDVDTLIDDILEEHRAAWVELSRY